MRQPHRRTASGGGPQGPAHDAKVARLLKDRLIQIERQVAVHQHAVDLLVGAHFHLTNHLRLIEQRAAARWGRP